MNDASAIQTTEPCSKASEAPFVLPVAEPETVVLPLLVVPAEVATVLLVNPSSERVGFLRRVFRAIPFVWEWCFGTAVLILGLAVLAAIPVFQFLSFGYLLEVSGRIGRTGRLRDGFIGYREAARFGGLILGAGLIVAPLQLVSSMWRSAELIEPGGGAALGWRIALIVLSFLAAVHIALACACGGRLRHFLFPFPNPLLLILRLTRGGYFTQVRDDVCDFVISLRLPHYFWLGLRGFLGSFVWLAIPVTMLAAGRQLPVVGVLGWVVLLVVLLYLPFLQVRFAAENRFRALFEVRAVRRLYCQAPWAFAFAFLITLSFALPLYLLKIEMIPREAAWLPNLVFIVFIFPARLMTGWSYGQAQRHEAPRHWFFRWSGRLTMLLLSAVYAVIVYFTQFVAWHGIWSLYEQHAFLLPVPFFKM